MSMTVRVGLAALLFGAHACACAGGDGGGGAPASGADAGLDGSTGGAFGGGNGGAMSSAGGVTSGGVTAAGGMPGGGPGGGAGGTLSGGPATPADAAQLADAFCQARFRCNRVQVEGAYGDVDRCAERVGLLYTARLGQRGTVLTGADLRACAAEYSDLDCAGVALGDLPEHCAIPGTLPGGEPCSDDSQCAGGRCDASPCGVCGSWLEAGQPCAVGALPCRRGTRCWVETGECKPLGSDGDACRTREDCIPTLTCVGGTCSPRAELDEPCSTNSDCDSANTLTCDPVTRRCVRATAAAVGEPCGEDNLFLCEPDATCDRFLSGQCIARIADGAACEQGGLASCTSPAQCVSGTCKIVDPADCSNP